MSELDLDKLSQLVSKLEKLERLPELLKLAEERDGYKTDLFKYKERLKELEGGDKATEVDSLKRKINELESGTNSQLSEKDQALNQYKKKLEEMTIRSHVKDSLIKNNGIPELLERHLMDRTSIVEENGVQKIVVKDKQGNLLTVNGQPATVDDLVNEFKSDAIYSRAFNSNKTSGAGLTNATGIEGDINDAENPWVTINLQKQSEIYLKDKTLAEKLKQRARLVRKT